MDEVTGRVIRGDACVAEGAAWLARHEPRFARALEETGPLPLRLRPDGFAQLLSAICSQQVSVASARAIWASIIDPNRPHPITDTRMGSPSSSSAISFSTAMQYTISLLKLAM